jgi:pimeloyl-ACP methyl ester carboxylesterase
VLWVVIGILAAWVVIDLIVRGIALLAILPILERSPPFAVEPTAPSPSAEQVTFTSSDGITLRGSLHLPSNGPPRAVVIFCPELGGDHWSAGWYCRALQAAGFAIFGFDFRNQGESDRLPGYAPIHWLTEYEVTDTKAAIDYVSQRADLATLPVALFGISRGGSAALVAAAQRREVRCVACEGVFSISSMSLHYTLRWSSLFVPPWAMRLLPIWHIRTTLVLARWVSQLRRHCRYVVLEDWLDRLGERPALMIVDGRDTYVLPEISETLFERFPKPASRRWLVKTAKHNLAREVDPDEFDRRIVEFFSQIAPRPATAQPSSVPKPKLELVPRPADRSVSS